MLIGSGCVYRKDRCHTQLSISAHHIWTINKAIHLNVIQHYSSIQVSVYDFNFCDLCPGLLLFLSFSQWIWSHWPSTFPQCPALCRNSQKRKLFCLILKCEEICQVSLLTTVFSAVLSEANPRKRERKGSYSPRQTSDWDSKRSHRDQS